MSLTAKTLTDAAMHARDNYEKANKKYGEKKKVTGDTSDVSRLKPRSAKVAEKRESKD